MRRRGLQLQRGVHVSKAAEGPTLSNLAFYDLAVVNLEPFPKKASPRALTSTKALKPKVGSLVV